MQLISMLNGRAPRPTTAAGMLPPQGILAPNPVAGALDPYAAIEKVPLQTKDGMKSRGFTVRLEDASAGSGWREVGVVSEDYLLIPNRDVRDLASEISMRAGGVWSLSKEFFDGRRYAYALALRDRGLEDVTVGDPVGLGLLFENSYDGSRRLSASLFVNRLVCSNGMITPKLFRRVRFKHDHSALGWEDETSRALEMLRAAPLGLRRFVRAAQTLRDLRMTTDELSTIRGSVLAKVPVTLWGKIVDQLLLKEDLTGWGLVNAATAVLWHSEKMTASDFAHNEAITTALLGYGCLEGEGASDYGEVA